MASRCLPVNVFRPDRPGIRRCHCDTRRTRFGLRGRGPPAQLGGSRVGLTLELAEQTRAAAGYDSRAAGRILDVHVGPHVELHRRRYRGQPREDVAVRVGEAVPQPSIDADELSARDCGAELHARVAATAGLGVNEVVAGVTWGRLECLDKHEVSCLIDRVPRLARPGIGMALEIAQVNPAHSHYANPPYSRFIASVNPKFGTIASSQQKPKMPRAAARKPCTYSASAVESARHSVT